MDLLFNIAAKQAERSNLRVFRTGAVIVDKNNQILGKGCSHKSSHSRAIHAEEHALRGSRGGYMAVIVTLARNGNMAYSSKPCVSCVQRLHSAGIEKVMYYERDNSGEWSITEHSVDVLFSRARGIHPTQYAKSMRVA